MSVVNKNSEILFLYDAQLCNPNGDPDEENKPRMDYETGRSLVSDVRFKRYLRDYWLEIQEETWKRFGYDEHQDIWIRKFAESPEDEPKTVSAKQRIDELARQFSNESAKVAIQKPEFKQWLLERLIDIRFFGATIPVGDEEGRGASITLTGPVQFTWGYSLNRAEILPSSTITSHFAGREQEEKGQYGTMGKDWRIKYALLAFYGTVSALRAKGTRLSDKDLTLLDSSTVKAIPLIATTRSKLNQTPRLYLRVEYKDDQTFFGDPRTWISLSRREGLGSIADVQLEYSRLISRLEEYKDKIEKIVFWTHSDFASGEELIKGLEEKGFKHQDISKSKDKPATYFYEE